MRLCTLVLLLITAVPAFTQPANERNVIESSDAGADVEILIRILEDEKARGRLLDKLRAAATGYQSDKPLPAVVSESQIVSQTATFVWSAAEASADLIATTIRLGKRAVAVISGTAAINVQSLWHSVRSVLLVVVVTFTAYFTLRLALKKVQRLLAAAAKRSGVFQRLGIIGLSAVADLITVLAAWAMGYAPALYIAWTGQMGSSWLHFLSAFLVVELAKVAARLLLAPRWPALRFARIDDITAAYWYFWVSRLVSIVGYTFLFLAPLLAVNVSSSAAGALRVVVLFCALAMTWVIILQNRDMVRMRVTRYIDRGGSTDLVRYLSALARFWHIVAIGYLTLIFLLWLADQQTALPFVLLATIQTLLAIVIGVVLTIVMGRLAAGGMHLPTEIKERLPLLEKRLNAFVPNVLSVVRAIIVVTVALAVAQVWRIADLLGWLSSEFGQRIVTSVIAAFLILLVAGLIHLAVQSWVEYRLNPQYGHIPSPRERTLLALFRNAFTIALCIAAFMLVLAELGVNIGPLLAGAGIIGLAVGFGSQKLVQDVINGAFIQFENAMNEGDMVTVGGITGIVERLTIRSVSLRTVDGAYHLIPFSSVDSVTNFMRNFSYYVADIGVAYKEKIPEVKQAMEDAFSNLKQTEHGVYIIDDFEMHGVTEFGESAITVRARIKTTPGQQWAVGRAYNEIIKGVFDERGIEIPFPHMTLYLGGDKQDKELLQSSTGSESPSKRSQRRVAKRVGQTGVSKKRRTNIVQDGPADEGDEALMET